MSYYSTTILGESPAPIIYYREDEVGGTTAIDATSTGNNGTYAGTLTYNQTGAIHGDTDTAILFAPTASVSIPFLKVDITKWTAISIEFWITMTSGWHYVVITSTNTSVTTYLDGAVYTGGSGDTINVALDFSTIGNGTNGTLDEIAIYNYALSPAQITKHYLIAYLLTSGYACVYANGTGIATFDTLRVTQYPDPSTSLANVGRAMYSNVNWNAIQPANTNIIVTTSLDNGITYQPSTNGNDIWGITTEFFATLALQQQPVGYFRLNDTGTSIADLSGNANTGTAHGGVFTGKTGALQGPGEQTDTCMLFDGTSGYITTPVSISGATAYSLAVWVKPSTLNYSGYLRFLANDNNLATTVSIFLGSNPNGAGLFFHVGNGTSAAEATSSFQLSTNSWTFLVGTWDGTTLKLYVNSTLVGTNTLSGPLGSTIKTMGIGCTPGSNDFFSGYIDEALMYPGALSQATITSLYNAALSGVGQTVNDSFTDDTHNNYTQTTMTGGSTATWTWNTIHSNISVSGGTNALLLYNTLWAYDTELLVDFYQSENGGVVWGYQDIGDFYLVKVADSAASSSPNTISLLKCTGGTLSTLSSTSISFPTQTHHRVFITMLSGEITVSLDENQLLSYTDGTPFPAGQCGLYNTGGTTVFYLFQCTPQSVDLSSDFLVTKQSLATSDPTATPQVTDHQSFAGDKNFATGSTIPQADYRQTVVSDNFDDLNTQSNYWWRIDDGALVQFKPQDADDSPFILQPQDVLTGTMPTVEYSGDLYRNEQVLTGVYDEGTFTEVKLGDGNSKTWNVANPIIAVPTIQLNGENMSVGIQGTDTGKYFYYQLNSNSITQDNSQTTLTENDVLIITYTGTYNIDFSISNTGGFPGTVTQQDMAAIDGTSGVVTAVEDVSQKNMNKAAATTYANQLLQRYGTIARTITFQTLHNGLKVGQSLPIFIPQLNIFDSVFLVVKIDTSARTLYDGSTQYVYDVTASEAAALSSWQKLFGRVMAGVKGKAPKVKA